MDGQRIQDFLTAEADALLATYRHFETLLPHGTRRGSAHAPEDGRYVETLLRACLQKFLPRSLEILSGFVLRPAVKTAKASRERQKERDAHSTQLDIIVYDSATYPVYQRFAEAAIVPPEGVLAIISVKKLLRERDIAAEAAALAEASLLCQCQGPDKLLLRAPFLAVVGMGSSIHNSVTNIRRRVFEELKNTYETGPAPGFEETLGYIGAFDSWSVFKERPSPQHDPRKVRYLCLSHRANERHLTLQHLMTGILGVFYDPSRRAVRRPGFTAFQSGRRPDGILGTLKLCGMRRKSILRSSLQV